MSWSISLSGPRKQVLAELEHAASIIYQAESMVNDLSEPNVSVSLAGSAFTSPTGSGMNVSAYVAGIVPQEPAPPALDQPSQADPTPEPAAPAALAEN